ncbi:MAG: hypothetical protein JNL32_03015 [Candidatus Kapabacteria bacterium]|nr:hypothetical protein [Candidatus Kapabacteria bacterium]
MNLAVQALNVAQDVQTANQPVAGNVPVWNATTGQWEANGQPLGNIAPFADVASATTADIGAAASENVRITGTTTITGLGTAAAGTKRRVRFAGALTLTHNATSLILPGAANITTAANDCAFFVSLGSGNWICTDYQRASGAAVVASVGGDFTWIVKSADESVVNSGTLQDDDHLFFSALANKSYLINIGLMYDCATAGAVRGTLRLPSMPAWMSGTGFSSVLYPNNNASNVGLRARDNDLDAILIGGDARGRGEVYTASIVVTIGATPGNVILRWAQNSVNATASIIKAGSYLAFRPLN